MTCKKIFKAINEGFGKFGGTIASFLNNLFGYGKPEKRDKAAKKKKRR